MATISNQMQKIVRHYVPMIRFKYGANRTDASTTQKSHETKQKEKSETLEFFETPMRFRRRPLTQEEIDLVTIGGRV